MADVELEIVSKSEIQRILDSLRDRIPKQTDDPKFIPFDPNRTLLVIADQGTVPAATFSGLDVTPGTANARILELNNGIWKPQGATRGRLPVQNYSSTAIPQSTAGDVHPFLAVQSRTGRWLAIQIESGSTTTPTSSDCGCATATMLRDKGTITEQEFLSLNCCSETTVCPQCNAGLLRNPIAVRFSGLQAGVSDPSTTGISLADRQAFVAWFNNRVIHIPLDTTATSCDRLALISNPIPSVTGVTIRVKFQGIAGDRRIFTDVQIAHLAGFGFGSISDTSPTISAGLIGGLFDGMNGVYSMTLPTNGDPGDGYQGTVTCEIHTSNTF